MSIRIAMIVGVLTLATTANAQVLDDIRNDVRKEDKPKCDDSNDRKRDRDCNNTNDYWDYSNILGGPSGSGSDGQSTLFQDLAALNAKRPTVYFLEYPYQQNYPGYVLDVDPATRTPLESSNDHLQPGPWHTTISAEYGYDFRNRVGRTGFNLLVDTTERWGIHTAWNTLTERLPNRTDTLTLGNMHLMYRLTESSRSIIRVGVGANTLIDRFGNNWGMNAHLDTNWFPVKPLVISTIADAGKLGATSVYHFRGTLGVNLQRLELYTGYDWLRIGSTTIHGPTAGLRVWY